MAWLYSHSNDEMISSLSLIVYTMAVVMIFIGYINTKTL